MSDGNEFTLERVREDIGFMEKRLREGQGNLVSSMCRLSLPASKWLLARVAELEHKVQEATLDGTNAERERCLGIAEEALDTIASSRIALEAVIVAIREGYGPDDEEGESDV
jgi:hypothetical protein